MKDIRKFAIGFLTLVLGLGLMSGTLESRDARAARIDRVPAMRVKNLGNVRGQYLNVLYAIGSRPFYSFDDSKVTVQSVRASKQVSITGDTVDLPALDVEKEGVRASYNLVILVVSQQQGFSWTNDDGSAYVGQLAGGTNQKTRVRALTKAEIEQFQMDHDASAVFEIGL